MPRFNHTRAKELCDQATPGPWRAYRCKWCDDGCACGIKGPKDAPKDDAYQRGIVYDTNRDECIHMMSLNDAVFIAESRTLLPAALDEIETLRAALKEALDAWEGLWSSEMQCKSDPLPPDRIAELRKLVERG
jgi:hypothetical protein